ncbi:Hypothetical protein FNO222_0586 [Francisella orientalis]|uniref:Uncharacterized protein n=1 Tax=Francisella orientalis TaxID=299583 RepID=A0ABN4H8E3_9GAMM|nr:hypothetical protein FNO12_0583 [Francisella orientalis FNO12]AKN86845.1 Hypothetical protein FNO24_0583 [Francisella orientalis FNO24]AKN88384.1 Hypothetical protein FNO190_0583 [Francisella orientalis]AKU05138.1 Hypothetical protein FNO01_0583 [Francisella orientalis]QEN20047.1 Hypothetical protein FNO39_0586 [Francisella orientalis]
MFISSLVISLGVSTGTNVASPLGAPSNIYTEVSLAIVEDGPIGCRPFT